MVPQAIKDACLNAKLNNICNATFVQGDLNKIDESFGNNFPKPDIIISGQTLHFPFSYYCYSFILKRSLAMDQIRNSCLYSFDF